MAYDANASLTRANVLFGSGTASHLEHEMSGKAFRPERQGVTNSGRSFDDPSHQ